MVDEITSNDAEVIIDADVDEADVDEGMNDHDPDDDIDGRVEDAE